MAVQDYKQIDKTLGETLPEMMKPWVNAVATGDVEKIVACYDFQQGRLNPTVEDGWYGTSLPRAIADYFHHFVEGKKFPAVEIFSCEKMAGCDAGYLGTYVFVWVDDKGLRCHLVGDYTFIFDKDSGKILSHTSKPWKDQPEDLNEIKTDMITMSRAS
jgi:hypothetical protein